MEDSKEKHSFRRGLALGALLAVAAFVLSGCTTAYFLPRFLGRRDSNEEQIDAKVQELNQYIEKYYLFDYEDEDVENGIYMCIQVIIPRRNMPALWKLRTEATAVSAR